MIFGSVCSGIEAASVAWAPLGWRPAFYSEIESFPISVLKFRHAAHDLRRGAARGDAVPLFGDFTAIRMRHLRRFGIALPDVLVGGTPCQGFSIAGLRQSLSDNRSNLALSFVRLAHAIDNARHWGGRPGLVVVWENVPGILTTGDNAFGCLISGFVGADGALNSPLERGRWPDAGMVEGPRARAAWRVLDAQYFGLAQRRERVFLVIGFRGAADPAAILFERLGLRGNPPPRRETRKDVAPTIAARASGGGGLGTDFDLDGGLIAGTVSSKWAKGSGGPSGDECHNLVAHALRGDGFDAGEDGTGLGTPIVPIAFSSKDSGLDACENVSPTLRAMGHGASHANAGGQVAVAQSQPHDERWVVRRLTPRECERLMGFPEITKSVTVFVWDSIEKAKNAAAAETQNHKSPVYVSHAAADESKPSANVADESLVTRHRAAASHVVLNVRIDLERMVVEISRPGKSLWSASIAEKASSSPLSMPVGDFVRLVAPMLQMLESGIHVGAEESQANITDSSHRLNGSASVHLSGDEIGAYAEDADKFTTDMARCTKFTTSGVGRSSPNSEPIWAIWSSCVVHAIASCIPAETRAESSFAVSIEVRHGYTAITYRGKSAADGPRYKALGNSMAVNVMRWIGRRIEAVELI